MTTRSGKYSVDDVKAAAKGRWPDILCAIGGFSSDELNGDQQPCRQSGCDGDGGTDRFQFTDMNGDGSVFCRHCCRNAGDGFAAIMWRMDWTFPQTLQAVGEYLNLHHSTTGHRSIGNAANAKDEETAVATKMDPATAAKPLDELRKQFIAWGTNTPEAQQRVDEAFQSFADAKPPITVDAIKAAGGLLVTWPISDKHGQSCIAIPATVHEGGNPSAYLLRRVDGQEFDAFGTLKSRKTHTLKGSTKAWIIGGGFERLRRAKYVLRVEGEADLLAVHPLLPSDWAVVTNSCGAKAVPDNMGIFTGKIVFSMGDADVPGQDGAIKFADKVQIVAELVKHPQLPYPIDPSHGKDLRDYFNDGHSFDELRAMCEAAPEFVKQKRGREKKQPQIQGVDDNEIDLWTSLQAEQGRTEIANSRRFLRQHRQNVRYCHPWGSWLVWNGACWKEDDSAAIERMAKTTADQIWLEAGAFTSNNDIVKFARQSSQSSGVRALLSLASSDVAIAVDDMDANHWLLNCANGTVNLRTGELQPHRQSDWITKVCPTRYNPGASTYHLDRFLESTFDNQSLIEFVQRLFGYCLTGIVSEQVLPVFYGGGSNGKSTLLTAIQNTVGMNYTSAAPPSLLMEKKNESHPTELAGLFGRRIVIAAETKHGARLSESLVKQLTGSDKISARRMKEDFWDFWPTHKIILCTNHKPIIKGTDHAIWRRLALIPFLTRFWNPDKDETGPPELKQDKSLPEKLNAEAEGILSWMVKGCVEWQRNGLQIPEIVNAATAEYRSESDTVGRFIQECCVTGCAIKVEFSRLYERLETWCDDSGDNRPSRKTVGQYLIENGFHDKQSGVRWYYGIGLKATDPVAAESVSF